MTDTQSTRSGTEVALSLKANSTHETSAVSSLATMSRKCKAISLCVEGMESGFGLVVARSVN